MEPERRARARHATEASSVLANRDFVKLWTGETVSLIGTQNTQLALPLVAILTLRADVFQVGLLNAMRHAPVVVFSLLAGVWLDRCRRRPVLVASDLACAVLIALIPVASALGVLSIWLLCGIAALVGVAQVFFDIGSLSYLPALVDRRHLAMANGRMQVSYAVAGIAGPSLAGLLIGLLGAPTTLAIDAVSCLFSMVMLLSIRRAEPDPPAREDRTPMAASIAEGLRAVFGNRLLRSLLMQSCTFNFAYNALITIFLVYAVRQLGLHAAALGLVLGVGSVVALVAAVFAGRITAALGPGRTLLVTTLGSCLSPLLLLIPSGPSPATLAVLAAAQAVSGATAVVFNITTVTLRQIVTPDRLLARMNGSYRLLLFGTGPLGAIAGGALGSALGLRSALVIAAIVVTTPAIWILFSPAFRLTEMPTGPDVVDDATAVGAAPAGSIAWWGEPTMELRLVEPAPFDWWGVRPRHAEPVHPATGAGAGADASRAWPYPQQRAS
jgi:MFS family permease